MAVTGDARTHPLSALFYGASLSLNAGLLSFLGVLVVGTWQGGEEALGSGIVWVFSIPWIVIAGLLGAFTFPWYCNRTTWQGKTAVYAGSVVGAVVFGLGGTMIFAWLAN